MLTERVNEEYKKMTQLVILKFQLVMHGCANEERQDMKQRVPLKVQLMLNRLVNADYQDMGQLFILNNVANTISLRINNPWKVK